MGLFNPEWLLNLPYVIWTLVAVFGGSFVSMAIKAYFSVERDRRDLALSSAILNRLSPTERERILKEVSNGRD